ERAPEVFCLMIVARWTSTSEASSKVRFRLQEILNASRGLGKEPCCVEPGAAILAHKKRQAAQVDALGEKCFHEAIFARGIEMIDLRHLVRRGLLRFEKIQVLRQRLGKSQLRHIPEILVQDARHLPRR